VNLLSSLPSDVLLKSATFVRKARLLDCIAQPIERVLKPSVDLSKDLVASATLLVQREVVYAAAPLLNAVRLELPMIARVARAVMCSIIKTNSMMDSADRIICEGN
jgi:hypothetical protein